MRKLVILLAILALCFTTGCSKKKKKEVEEPASNSKTVDLGETAPEDSDEKAEAPKDKKPSRKDDAKREGRKRPPKDDADEGDKEAKEREWARKNEEASKNPDGTPKRGKPAAEEEFEEAQKAKAEKEDKKKPKAEEESAPEAQDNTIDFDDDTETADAQPAPPPPREAKPKPALNIEKYINIRELREQTSYSGALAEDWLLGQNTDARYSSARLATDKPEQLGFTVQVWKPGNEANASKRFNDLFKQSFGGQKITGVATEAFIASHHNIHELGFYEKSKRSAVLLSCSEEICSKDQLKSIALVILRRL